jgi:outer membrane protein OmpA-like peptidoglycan-associated protein
MNRTRIVRFGLAALACALSLTATAQEVERDTAVLSQEVTGRLDGFNYKEGPESELEFRGTAIALGASGEAEVEFQDGRARVDVEVEKLPSPGSLGPFATYVLWAVTADGNANNIGALEVKDGKAELEATTPLSQFALIVTAEPHFAVTVPSRAIVLQNLAKRVQGEKFNITGLKERIDYAQLSPQLRDEKHEVPSDLIQARYALAIADGAEAEKFAAAEYQKATALLAQAEAAQKGRKYSEKKMVPQMARDAVQTAEDARRTAVEGAAAERSRVSADNQAAAAASAATAAEAADGQRRAAIAAEESAAAAKGAAETARRAARADLVSRLNNVLPTHDTDRGIVAEISGVQFATGKATLNDGAREALARFAGIVGVYPSMKFNVEGHTDSTGGYEFNRELSLKRASAVRDYLVTQSVASSSIDVEGLGPDRPVAGNDTADGRARNRRVEIILQGDPVAGT